MSSVVISGNTSGSVTVSAPDVAGSVTATLPSVSGTLATVGGGSVQSGSITLTASSSADQYVTPTQFGQAVTLPDATTLSTGKVIFTIYNNSGFPYMIKDNGGNLLGFVKPNDTVNCNLADKSTTNGTWNLQNHLLYSIEATSIVQSPSNDYNTYFVYAVKVSATQDMVFWIGADNGSGSDYYFACIYDSSTQTFGSVVTVRAVTFNTQNRIIATTIDSSNVLAVSVNSTTAVQAVNLSISGTTITVGTAATATLAGNLSNIGQLYNVGSSYVWLYNRATSVGAMRAFTVSAGTVTIGAETTVSGTNVATFAVQNGSLVQSSSVILVPSYSATTWYATPYTISGTTITAGTAANTTYSALGYGGCVAKLTSGRYAVLYSASASTWDGMIVSVSGTTATISTVSLGVSRSTYPNNYLGWGVGNQYIFCAAQSSASANLTISFNVLTDNAGTAVAGTPITDTYGSAGSGYMGTNRVVAANTTTNDVTYLFTYFYANPGDSSGTDTLGGIANTFFKIGVSGNNPVFKAKSTIDGWQGHAIQLVSSGNGGFMWHPDYGTSGYSTVQNTSKGITIPLMASLGPLNQNAATTPNYFNPPTGFGKTSIFQDGTLGFTDNTPLPMIGYAQLNRNQWPIGYHKRSNIYNSTTGTYDQTAVWIVSQRATAITQTGWNITKVRMIS